jgi:hypothetical protein
MAIRVHFCRTNFTQAERLQRQCLQSGLFHFREQTQWSLVGRAVITYPGNIPDPTLQMLIGTVNVSKFLSGHEIALHIMHAVFNFTFVTFIPNSV